MEVLLKLKEADIVAPPLCGKGKEALLDSIDDKTADRHDLLKPEITDRPMEVAIMIDAVYGKTGKTVYTVLGLLTFETALAAHCTVFASSLTSNIPLFVVDACNVYDFEGFINECRWKYLVWLAVFLVIVITLTVIGMAE